MVMIESVQPPETLPPSGLVSSITNRFQTPFGFEPLKTENDASPGAAGAGVGKAKSKVERRFVGLKVPEVSGPK